MTNDAVPKVEEVDFVSIGPTDLSADMGLPGDLLNPVVVERVEELGAKIKVRCCGIASFYK